jgi:hypothetical protein
MKIIYKLVLVMSVLILITSCEKKVLTFVPVIEIEKDMSIPGAKNIMFFSFPSALVGYAASDSGVVYKTIDGGSSWKTITFGNDEICKGIEFFNETSGICLKGNNLYSTTDGGQIWKVIGYGDFIGKTKDGIGVLGECNNSICSISTSNNNGKSFEWFGDMFIDGDFTSARVVDSKVFVFSEDVAYYDRVYGMDLSNYANIIVNFESITGNPSDIYLSSFSGAVVGPGGMIMDINKNNGYSYSCTYESYDGSFYCYYTVDGYDDLIVAAGDKTIATNKDFGMKDKWNEVFDKHGNGFDHTFYKICFIGQNTFYISGNNGLILKARI